MVSLTEQINDQVIYDVDGTSVIAKNTFLEVCSHRDKIARKTRRRTAPELAWRFAFSASADSSSDDGESSCESLDMQEQNITTLMMKNIPCSCRKEEVIHALEEFGFMDSCNFFYCPTRRGKIIGYSFIGFADPQLAEHFSRIMSGYRFANRNSDKVVSVVPASVQGIRNNVEHFKKTSVIRKKERPVFRRRDQAQIIQR